jgi:hypothetical protein
MNVLKVMGAITVLCLPGSTARTEELKDTKPLPDKITKAWKDAGATAGWMKMEETGLLTFVEKPETGAIPAFRFQTWKDGVVTKLPAPDAPFGLYLSKTEITDSGIKELDKFKNLKLLCLCETKATDDAVEKLRNALPKCFIFHC